MEGKGRKRSNALSRLMAAASILVLILTGTAIAQQNTGTILGVVKDSTGAVVPGVSVTILNEETGLTRLVITGENGAFRAPALPVGHYTVRVELAGFQMTVFPMIAGADERFPPIEVKLNGVTVYTKPSSGL